MKLGIYCITVVIICAFGFLNSLAADVIDEFDSDKLNTDLWEIRAVGGASYEIDDGILTLSSPDVASGITLYMPKRNIEELDITFEIKVDTSEGMDFSFPVGSYNKIIDPQLNTEINKFWMAGLLFLPAGNVMIKEDPENIGNENSPTVDQVPFDAGWQTVVIEFSESRGKVTYYLDGDKIGEVDKNPAAEERYFMFSPDPYTSHYTGTAKIEYIRISGPGSLGLVAVEPVGKLAAMWAGLKMN